MVTKKVNKEKLSNLNTSSTESEIYLLGNDCVKIINNDLLDSIRIEVIKRLSNIKDDECTIPKYLVAPYNSNDICGYGMEYLKNYATLSSLVLNNELTIEMRKDIINKVCKLILKLLDDDFIFIDIHQDNILYKDGNIKLIDLDSGFYKDMMDETMYINFLKALKILLTRLCFNLLLNTNINFEKIDISRINAIYGMSTEKQKEFIIYLYNLGSKNISGNINPADYIDSFDEEYLNAAKSILR